MSLMIKLAFALPLTLAAVVGHGSSTSASSPAPVPNRVDCSVCDEVYDSCIAEGITPAGCKRMTANCYKNCLLP